MVMRIRHLQTKILVGTIGLVVLLGLTVTVFVASVVYAKLIANLEKRGVFMARTVAEQSVDSLLTENTIALDMMVRDFKKSEENVEYIFITNAAGEVAAHTFENGFPTDLRKKEGPVNEHVGRIRRFETEEGSILDFSAPILMGRAGFAHVGMVEAPIRKSVSDMIEKLLGIILAVLLGGSGLAVILSAAITKPVKELAGAAAAVGSGLLDLTVRQGGADEIGQLGVAFNEMIEKRKQAEAGLRLSEKKLRDITSHLAEGLYVLDASGMIMFMNPEAERLLGWTMAELNEKGAHTLVHFRTADGTELPLEACRMHNVMNTGERFLSDDEVFVRKDGTVFPIFVVSSPIFEEGHAVASVTAFRDISDQKQLEQEREQLMIEHMAALSQIKTLAGLLPICASCKRIRDDKGYWNQIEAYIEQHSDAEFSHGICPECARKIYPGYYKDNDNDNDEDHS